MILLTPFGKGIYATSSIIFLYMVFGSIQIQAQEHPVNNTFVGTWLVDFNATLSVLNEEKYASFEKMSKPLKMQYEGRKYVFSDDHTYEISLANNTISTGIWSFSENESALRLTDKISQNQYILDYKVTFDTEFIILHLTGDNSQFALFRDLYLKRI